MLHFATTYPTQAAALKFHFDLGTSVPKGFLANGVNRIQGEHVLDLISSTEVTGGKGWLAGCNGNVPQCGKITRGGICLPTTESELEGFLANRVCTIHGEHVLDLISSSEVTGGKGWLVGWNGNVPQCGKIARGGICLPTEESHLGGFLANAVDGIHGGHVVDVISSTGAAGAKGWFVGWNGKVPPRWKKSPRWERFAPNGVRTGAIPGQQSTQNSWRTCC